SHLLENDEVWVIWENAIKLYPDLFKQQKTVPKEISEFMNSMHPVYRGLVRITDETRETVKNSPSHWSHLPWEWWLRDRDFLKCIKAMHSFWKQPQTNEVDWLESIVRMTRDTFSQISETK